MHLFSLVLLLSYGSWLHYMLGMWCDIYAGCYATGDTHLSLYTFTFSLIIIVYVGWFVWFLFRLISSRMLLWCFLGRCDYIFVT